MKGNKRRLIKVTFGTTGEVSIKECNSKKMQDKEYKRLTSKEGYKIYDGNQYTSDYKVEKVSQL